MKRAFNKEIQHLCEEVQHLKNENEEMKAEINSLLRTIVSIYKRVYKGFICAAHWSCGQRLTSNHLPDVLVSEQHFANLELKHAWAKKIFQAETTHGFPKEEVGCCKISCSFFGGETKSTST